MEKDNLQNKNRNEVNRSTPVTENPTNQVGTRPRLTVELHVAIREWIPGREAVHIHKAEFSTLEVNSIEEAYSHLNELNKTFMEWDEDNAGSEIHKTKVAA